MVLRKPYALLIKHFKLFHVFITFISLFLFLKCNDLLSFLNEYIANSGFIVDDYRIQEVLPFYLSALIIFLIILNIIAAVLLKNKGKSITFYIINIVLYSVLLVGLSYTSSILVSMSTRIVDTRVIRALRDIFNILSVTQIISFCMYAFRATGFDFKKFNFTKDLIDLQIEEKDREEVEVAVDIDINKIDRKSRKSLRMLKYFYFENQFLCNIVLGVVGVILSIVIVTAVINKGSTYKQFQVLNVTGYSFQIEDVYITDKDKNGNVIEADKSFVIVEINAKKNTSRTETLNLGRLELKSKNMTYHHNGGYKDSFDDFGTVYTNQELSSEYKKYFLIYRIDKKDSEKNLYLNYVGNASEIVINFKSIRMEENKTDAITLKENKNLDNTILDGYTLTINKYELNKKIQINYTYSIGSNKISAKEYIVPTISTNYDKAVLKIDGTLSLPEEYNSYVTSMTSLLNRFGFLRYTIEGKTYTSKFLGTLSSQKVKQENTIYFEVLDEVLDATNITLVLQIRNQIYELVLKDGVA